MIYFPTLVILTNLIKATLEASPGSLFAFPVMKVINIIEILFYLELM